MTITTPAASPARARVVEEIKDLMTSGRWRASKSHKELAEKHGLSQRYVKDLATQAGNELHALMIGKTEEEQDAARARILARMEALREDALARTRTYVNKEGEVSSYPDPDFKVALDVDKAELETFGLKAPVKRQEVAPDEVAKMSREEKIAAHKQALAELEGEKEGMH